MINSIKKEINRYRYYITNRNSGIKKKHICKISTYKKIIKPNLKAFIDYIENHLNKKPRSLLVCISYLISYTKFVINKYKTSYIKTKLQFTSSLSHFLKEKICKNEKEKRNIDKIIIECRNKINNHSFEETKRQQNKQYRQQFPYKKLVLMIKNMTERTINEIRDKLILSILSFTGWRANNILEMKLGETIFKSNGEWWYNFPTNLQKSHTEKTSKIGEFPSLLHKLLDKYIEKSGIKENEYIFRTKKLTKWKIPFFTNLVKRISMNLLGIELNPHVFRDILFSYLLENDCSLIHAQLVLWHVPSISKSDSHYFVANHGKSLIKVNQKYIEPLYKEKPLHHRNKITIENINPDMMQEIMNVISKYNPQNENIA
jgi:integrase